MGRCEFFLFFSQKCLSFEKKKDANRKKQNEKEKPETFTHDDDTGTV